MSYRRIVSVWQTVTKWTVMSAAKKEPLKTGLTVDKQILALYTTFNFDMEKNSKKKASIKKRLRVLKIIADQTAKKQFENINQYYLTKKVHPAIGGGTANGILKDFVQSGILKTQVTKSKKKQTKFLNELTAKGVIACTALTDFQSPSRIKLLLDGTTLENQPFDKLASLLNIYNEGYVRCDNNNGSNISPVVIVLHELTANGRRLDFEHMTDDAILKELQSFQENAFAASIKTDIFQSFGSLYSKSMPDEAREKLLKFMGENKDKPESITLSLSLTKVLIEAITSPEIFAFLLNHEGELDFSSLIGATYQKLLDWKVYNRKIEDFKSTNEIFVYMLMGRANTPDDFNGIEQSARYMVKAVREVMLERMPKVKQLSFERSEVPRGELPAIKEIESISDNL